MPRPARTAPAARPAPFRPAVAWAAAGVVALLMLGLLTAQLVTVRSQLTHARSQDRQAKLLLRSANPTLTRLPPALQTLAPAIPLLAPSLRAFRNSRPGLTAQLTRTAVARALPVLDALSRAPLADVLGQLALLARTALDRGRLRAALEGSSRFFSLTERLRLLPALADAARRLPKVALAVPRLVVLQRRALARQDESLAVQRQSLVIQRQTLTLLEQSLAVQRQVLAHAESLDRKVP